MSNNKIKVKITCARKVDYQKTVEIDELHYNRIKDLMGDDITIHRNKDAFFTLDGLIDGYDIVNADDEFMDVTVETLD